MAQLPSRPEARSRLGSQTANELGAPVASSIPEPVAWARARISKEGVRRRSRFAESTTSLGPTATAGGTTCRLHGKPRADPFGRVKAVAAHSAGARSASLDVAKSISDPSATTSQLLIRSPRRRTRAAPLEL